MPLNNPISNSDLIAFSDTSGNIVATNVKGALTESAVKIADNAYSPENYSGNALQKLQGALDAAYTNNKSVKLSKIYDITGLGSLKINKVNHSDRQVLMISGGGIAKHDAGYIFTTDLDYVGDIFLDSVKFVSTAGVGCIVFDCNKLIRITTSMCSLRNVDSMYYADSTKCLQSIRSVKDYIVGGSGWVADFVGAYDFSVDGVVVNSRESGYRQRAEGTINRSLYNVRIISSLFEGLTGYAFLLSNTDSLKIDGCFFESNGHNIEFESLASIQSAEISNNRHGGADNGTKLIKWGKVCHCCKSHNNVTQNLGIHDGINITSGYIFSELDYCSGGTTDVNNTRIKYFKSAGGNSHYYAITGGYGTYLGLFKRLYVATLNIAFEAGELKQIVVAFPEELFRDDVISIQFDANDKNITIQSYLRDNSTKTNLNIWVKNNEAIAISGNSLYASVLKPFATIVG